MRRRKFINLSLGTVALATLGPVARLGLIPKKINIAEIVWKWTPGS